MPRAVVTGGAGFLGSHLCERLLREGWQVVCLDSFLTGDETNLEGLRDRDGFEMARADVTQPIDVDGDIDWVMHLASPASPIDYLEHPIQTLEVNSVGAQNALDLALSKSAAFFLTSTSEVYGDP